jgi:hypothetical protein
LALAFVPEFLHDVFQTSVRLTNPAQIQGIGRDSLASPYEAQCRIVALVPVLDDAFAFSQVLVPIPVDLYGPKQNMRPSLVRLLVQNDTPSNLCSRVWFAFASYALSQESLAPAHTNGTEQGDP